MLQRFFHRHDPLLSTVYEKKYKPQKLRTRSPLTHRAYEITLRHFDRYLERPARLSDLCDSVVSEFLEWRVGRVVARTANRDLTNLRAMSDWLWRHGIITKPIIDVEPYAARRKAPKALTMEEFNRVWKSIAEHPGYIGRVRAPVFLRACVLAFWDTAERFKAVMSIRICDVDLQSQSILVRGLYRKGNSPDRVYPITPQTVEAIELLLGELGNHINAEHRLFQMPYDKSRLWRILGEVMVRAGFPDDARHKTHLIRRTVATDIASKGGDATKHLDHARPEVTHNNYIDPRIAHDSTTLDLLSRPGREAG